MIQANDGASVGGRVLRGTPLHVAVTDMPMAFRCIFRVPWTTFAELLISVDSTVGA